MVLCHTAEPWPCVIPVPSSRQHLPEVIGSTASCQCHPCLLRSFKALILGKGVEKVMRSPTAHTWTLGPSHATLCISFAKMPLCCLPRTQVGYRLTSRWVQVRPQAPTLPCHIHRAEALGLGLRTYSFLFDSVPGMHMWIKLEQYVFLTASWLKTQADKWKQTQLYVNEKGLRGEPLLPEASQPHSRQGCPPAPLLPRPPSSLDPGSPHHGAPSAAQPPHQAPALAEPASWLPGPLQTRSVPPQPLVVGVPSVQDPLSSPPGAVVKGTHSRVTWAGGLPGLWSVSSPVSGDVHPPPCNPTELRED